QQAVVDARAKQRGSTALSGQPIAMGPGNPLDQSVQSQPANVGAHLPPGHVDGRLAPKRRPIVPQVAAGENTGEQAETQQGTEQGWQGKVGEWHPAGMLPLDLDRLIDPAKRVFADAAILADPLDIQETSIG